MRASPLAKAADGVHAGDIITHVNNTIVPPGSDPAQYLTDTVDKEIEVTLSAPERATRRVRVKPVSNVKEATLAYHRWAEWQRRETERLSGGRLGYVHMPEMDEEAFRALVDDVLGSFITKEGIVFDTRFNQGGWMHEPLLAFFSVRISRMPAGDFTPSRAGVSPDAGPLGVSGARRCGLCGFSLLRSTRLGVWT